MSRELGITALNTGDSLVCMGGSYLEIDDIQGHWVEDQMVYNIDVDGDNTYFANGYLVHNKTTGASGGGTISSTGGPGTGGLGGLGATETLSDF